MRGAPVLIALDVAAGLTQSGVDATTRVTPDGRVELLVLLEPTSRAMAILDVTDLSTALIDEQDVEPRTVPGPLDHGLDACDAPSCLTVPVWVWVLGWRGTVV